MTSKERQQLEKILTECDNGRYDMGVYMGTLEEPHICTRHFDKIEKIVNAILKSDKAN